MGTIINGNKWSGACVNGNVISGLVKNGAVFYKKNQQELYKRRIMIGDNLDKKTLFFDFPDDFYKNFQNEFVYENYIITCENNSYLPGIAFSVGLDPNTLDRMDIYDYALGIENPIYKYDIINNSLKSNMKKALINVYSGESGKVISITNDSNDSKIYRNIYIEDPNIRPLQSTDIITTNTKFYFNFPDNLYEELIEYYYEIESDTFIIINNENNDNIIFQVDYSPDAFFTISVSYRIGMERSKVDIYVYDEYAVSINESKLFLTAFEEENFTIAELDTNSPIYKYILVDTTTLGN